MLSGLLFRKQTVFSNPVHLDKKNQQLLYKQSSIQGMKHWHLEYSIATCASQAKHEESKTYFTSFASEIAKWTTFRLRKQKGQNEHHFAMEPSVASLWGPALKQTVFVQAWRKSVAKFCNMLQPLWHKYSTLRTVSY